MIRWIVISLLLLSLYGTIKVIAAYYGVQLPPLTGWTATALREASPWGLMLFAALCWHKTRQWRYMQARREGMPSLSRGAIVIMPRSVKPHRIERFCRLSFLFSLLSLPYWYGISGPVWIAATILSLWFFIRLTACLLRVRRQS